MINLFHSFFVAVLVAIVQVSSTTTVAAAQCLSDAERLDGAKMAHLKDGQVIEYHVLGVDPTGDDVTRLVIQHGTGREGGAFGYFDSFFKAHNLAVVAPTMPGHGCSTRQPSRRLGEWGASVASVLKQEKWLNDNKGFFVAGYSFGAPHALALLGSPALDDHIKGMFLVSSTLAPELRSEIAESELPSEIIPLKSWITDPSYGPPLMKFVSTVAKRRAFGKLYKAMDRLRAAGLGPLSDWLQASNDRVFSHGLSGMSDNLRLRESDWGFLPAVRLALSQKSADFPLLLLSEKTDSIDPSAVSEALAQYLNAGNERNVARHIVWPEISEHDHWHYWERFETHLWHFLSSISELKPKMSHGLESSARCEPVPAREYGPFYKPGQPFKNTICERDEKAEKLGWAVADSTFTRSWQPGLQPLEVSGTVTAWNGKACIPVANAEIDVWQSHQYGPYGNLNPNEQDGFCRGVVRTDENGHFSFSTFMPGSYGVLAGSGPFGPGVDIAPFVDRHIHLAIWAPGYELGVTQMLHLDDPLLKSGVRSLHHGYEGTGVLVRPENHTDKWHFKGVELAMPRSQRPSRIFETRQEAARAFCSYSAGDILTPAVCMPSVVMWISPMTVYFLLMPCLLYVVITLGCMLLCLGTYKIGTRYILRSNALPNGIKMKRA